MAFSMIYRKKCLGILRFTLRSEREPYKCRNFKAIKPNEERKLLSGMTFSPGTHSLQRNQI